MHPEESIFPFPRLFFLRGPNPSFMTDGFGLSAVGVAIIDSSMAGGLVARVSSRAVPFLLVNTTLLTFSQRLSVATGWRGRNGVSDNLGLPCILNPVGTMPCKDQSRKVRLSGQ